MKHGFDFGLFFTGIPLAFASRAANIGACSRLINLWRTHKLPANLQKMLLAVGLRGAVAYGLSETRLPGLLLGLVCSDGGSHGSPRCTSLEHGSPG
jgi:hypothetical protein